MTAVECQRALHFTIADRQCVVTAYSQDNKQLSSVDAEGRVMKWRSPLSTSGATRPCATR